MRELSLTDATRANFVITFWNLQSENLVAEHFSVIVVRNSIVREFQSKKKVNYISGTLVWTVANINDAV